MTNRIFLVSDMSCQRK